MKNIIIIIFLFVSFATYSQVDTTFKIDMSQNVSRCNCETTFGEKLKAYRIANELSEATMAAWLSSIASGVHLWRVSYSIDDYKAMENGKFFPFLKVQETILEHIEKQSK
jgi:hypothetical protein